MQFALAVIGPALALAPSSYLSGLRKRMGEQGLRTAVASHDTRAIYDWLIGLMQLQGISDAVAFGYSREHGTPTWDGLSKALDGRPSCPRLRCYWSYAECRYQKAAATCASADLLASCLVPKLPARNGRLSQAAVSLYLFIRDVCDGDLVGWLNCRLAQADQWPGAVNRGRRLSSTVAGPLSGVHGLSDKVLSMALADLLLGGDPDRERWVTAGASMIAIDSLVHNILHRTGILHRLEAEHSYGERCYRPGGCADIIEAVSHEIDARRFSPDFPAYFPRFVQQAIWRFCAQGELNICNGNRINDQERCGNRFCPTYGLCDRVRT